MRHESQFLYLGVFPVVAVLPRLMLLDGTIPESLIEVRLGKYYPAGKYLIQLVIWFLVLNKLPSKIFLVILCRWTICMDQVYPRLLGKSTKKALTLETKSYDSRLYANLIGQILDTYVDYSPVKDLIRWLALN